MDSLNWGKCLLAVLWANAGESTKNLKLFPIAAEDTTELGVDEGEEIEATVEGGEVEAVRSKANKYNLAAQIRTLAGRKKPLKDKDGKVSGSGSVILIPENFTEDYGIYIENANAKLIDSFTAADGGRFLYRFKALKAAEGNSVKWGKIGITGTGITDLDSLTAANITSITFTEIQTEGETAPTEQTIYSKTTNP